MALIQVSELLSFARIMFITWEVQWSMIYDPLIVIVVTHLTIVIILILIIIVMIIYIYIHKIVL